MLDFTLYNPIYNYYVYGDRIEFIFPGSVTTFFDKNDIEIILAWIEQGKKYARKDKDMKAEICTYLEYMIKYGQYEQ